MAKKTALGTAGIILLLIFIFREGWTDIVSAWGQVPYFWLIIMLGLQVFTLLLGAYQWYHLLKNREKSLSLLEVFSINLVGSFVESVTPSVKLGGEGAKIFLLKQKTGRPYADLTGVLLVHKFISLVPFLLILGLVLFAGLLNYSIPGFIYWSFGSLVVLLLVFSWVIFRKWDQEVSEMSLGFLGKVRGFILRMLGSVRERREKISFLQMFAISILIWSLYPVKVFILSRLIGMEIDFLLVSVATFIAYLISMLPLSPGGIGTYEGTLAVILNLNGIPLAEGLGLVLLSRIITFWIPLVWAGLATVITMKNYEEKGFLKGGKQNGRKKSEQITVLQTADNHPGI